MHEENLKTEDTGNFINDPKQDPNNLSLIHISEPTRPY